jgi:deoxyadenosine/deoxycytidine kinase
MQAPILISIEGNIGSGKSTLLRELRARNPTWHFVDEPVDSWMSLKDDNGKNILEHFYTDKHRWAYTFQNTALLTRILNIRAAVEDWKATGCSGKRVFITERCVQTDANVFAKLMYNDKDMNHLEWVLYKKWYDAFENQVMLPSAYIHVDTPALICSERIGKRGRNGEEGIPMEYLERLHDVHDAWLKEPSFSTPVLRVDNVSETPTRVEDVEKFVQEILADSEAFVHEQESPTPSSTPAAEPSTEEGEKGTMSNYFSKLYRMNGLKNLFGV